jgi:hypothetical protein
MAQLKLHPFKTGRYLDRDLIRLPHKAASALLGSKN